VAVPAAGLPWFQTLFGRAAVAISLPESLLRRFDREEDG
jgi:glycogen debranching enzyme